MLRPAVELTLAYDPALPGRDLLLSPDAVADRLARTLAASADLRAATLVRAKYRIGESLRVVYRVDVAGREELVSGRMFPIGASERAYDKALRTAPSGGLLRPVGHDAELHTVWWTFPNDRRLTGLHELLHPTAGLSRLAAHAGSDRGAWQSSEVVEYAPERSVTLRAAGADGGTVAYAKAYAPETVQVGELARRYVAIAAALDGASDTVVVPTVLAAAPERNLLLLQAMEGCHWGELEKQELRRAMSVLGAAIAAVHDIPLDGSELAAPLRPSLRRFPRLNRSRVVRSGELIGLARPDVREQAATLAASLASGPPTADRHVLLHGDCHPKNALLQGDRMALIDFDQAGYGVAAADVGSLLARLRHGELMGEHPGVSAAELGDAFLAGYAGVRPPPSEPSLRWHVAACLLVERAMRAVNRVNRAALEQLDDVLESGHLALSTGVTT